jgi:hypothetical protein
VGVGEAMDKHEASAVLRERLADYRALPFPALAARVGTVDYATAHGPSGAAYRVEIQVLWDRGLGDAVRVRGAIDEGGVREFVPVCDSFIRGRDRK